MVRRVLALIVASVFLVNGKCEGKIKKEKYEWIKVNYIFKIISFSRVQRGMCILQWDHSF